MLDKPVRACICHGRSFEELWLLAKSHAWTTAEQVSQATGCGSSCGQCRRYIERMLETGETRFDILPIESHVE